MFCNTCLNITERGLYIVQECPEISGYVLWNKQSRVHLQKDGKVYVANDKMQAIAVAEELASRSMFGTFNVIPQDVTCDLEGEFKEYLE